MKTGRGGCEVGRDDMGFGEGGWAGDGGVAVKIMLSDDVLCHAHPTPPPMT